MKFYASHKYSKPIGRSLKNPQSPYILAKITKAVGTMNVEVWTLCTGTNIHRANNIKSKILETANCRTGICHFFKKRDVVIEGMLSYPYRNMALLHSKSIVGFISVTPLFWPNINLKDPTYEQNKP